MSTVTPNLGLVKPTTLEQYALSVLNNNMDILDAAAIHIDTVNSSADWTNFDFRQSVFTRIRVGNTGIIVAHILAIVDTATALPINTATGANYGNVAPVGYRPKNLFQGYFPAIQSGAGRGDEVQAAIATNGDWLVRSNTGSALTPTVGAVVRQVIVYEWDGNL